MKWTEALLIQGLLVLFCQFTFASPNRSPARIKRILTNPEVYEGEGVHIQCLVEYQDPLNSQNVEVEMRRSVFNTSEVQSLSSNGKVLIKEPPGQKYEAYVANSGSKSKEHAFKIQNIQILQDSGIYQCLVKSHGRVIDSKQTPVQVYEEDYNTYSYDLLDGSSRILSDLLSPEIMSHEQQTDEIHILANEVPEKLKCSSERQAKPQGIDLSFPVVCAPKNQSKNDGIHQWLGAKASLPCVAEAHPPPTVTWYKEISNTEGAKELVKLHMGDKVNMAIDEYRDFYLTVSLTIPKVEEADYGTYVCIASNSKGDEDSMKITLEKPKFERTSSASVLGINISISWILVLILLGFYSN